MLKSRCYNCGHALWARWEYLLVAAVVMLVAAALLYHVYVYGRTIENVESSRPREAQWRELTDGWHRLCQVNGACREYKSADVKKGP